MFYSIDDDDHEMNGELKRICVLVWRRLRPWNCKASDLKPTRRILLDNKCYNCRSFLSRRKFFCKVGWIPRARRWIFRIKGRKSDSDLVWNLGRRGCLKLGGAGCSRMLCMLIVLKTITSLVERPLQFEISLFYTACLKTWDPGRPSVCPFLPSVGPRASSSGFSSSLSQCDRLTALECASWVLLLRMTSLEVVLHWMNMLIFLS